MPKAPDIGAFGAAIPPGTEVLHAADEMVCYRVKSRIDDIISFYEAVYAKTEGLSVTANREQEPIGVTVTSDAGSDIAGFAMVTAVAASADGRLVNVLVAKQGAKDDEPYPDDNPWIEPS